MPTFFEETVTSSSVLNYRVSRDHRSWVHRGYNVESPNHKLGLSKMVAVIGLDDNGSFLHWVYQ